MISAAPHPGGRPEPAIKASSAPGTISQRDALIIELRRDGMTLEALGQWFKLSKTQIMYICENGPQTKREWQRARRAAIVQALATGRRHEDIAAEFGCSRSLVSVTAYQERHK